MNANRKNILEYLLTHNYNPRPHMTKAILEMYQADEQIFVKNPLKFIKFLTHNYGPSTGMQIAEMFYDRVEEVEQLQPPPPPLTFPADEQIQQAMKKKYLETLGIHVCPYCQQMFENAGDLQSHRDMKHSNPEEDGVMFIEDAQHKAQEYIGAVRDAVREGVTEPKPVLDPKRGEKWAKGIKEIEQMRKNREEYPELYADRDRVFQMAADARSQNLTEEQKHEQIRQLAKEWGIERLRAANPPWADFIQQEEQVYEHTDPAGKAEEVLEKDSKKWAAEYVTPRTPADDYSDKDKVWYVHQKNKGKSEEERHENIRELAKEIGIERLRLANPPWAEFVEKENKIREEWAKNKPPEIPIDKMLGIGPQIREAMKKAKTGYVMENYKWKKKKRGRPKKQ